MFLSVCVCVLCVFIVRIDLFVRLCVVTDPKLFEDGMKQRFSRSCSPGYLYAAVPGTMGFGKILPTPSLNALFHAATGKCAQFLVFIYNFFSILDQTPLSVF